VDAKTIHSIIASLDDRQSQFMAKLKRMDDERPYIEMEYANNDRALQKWREALEEAKE